MDPKLKYNYEEELTEEAMSIPPIVRIYMDIKTMEQFKELKKDATRLLTDVKLCQSCCLHFTTTLLENKRQRQARRMASNYSQNYKKNA